MLTRPKPQPRSIPDLAVLFRLRAKRMQARSSSSTLREQTSVPQRPRDRAFPAALAVSSGFRANRISVCWRPAGMSVSTRRVEEVGSFIFGHMTGPEHTALH